MEQKYNQKFAKIEKFHTIYLYPIHNRNYGRTTGHAHEYIIPHDIVGFLSYLINPSSVSLEGFFISISFSYMAHTETLEGIDTALLEDFDNMDDIRSYLLCKYDLGTADHVYQLLERIRLTPNT